MPSNAIRSETLISLHAQRRTAMNSASHYRDLRNNALDALEKAQADFEKFSLVVRLLEQALAGLRSMIEDLEREENT